MTGNITLAIIKPCAIKKGFTGKILTKILEAGFKIIALKYVKLTKEEAENFYEIHKGKPFFNELVEFMSSAPVIPMILFKQNAVEDFRRLIGATDPAKAEPNTIRYLYAESITHNAIHGSDSDENAQKEANFFFSLRERYYPDNS